MKLLSGIGMAVVLIAGVFLFLFVPRSIVVKPEAQAGSPDGIKVIEDLPVTPEPPVTKTAEISAPKSADIENQPPLANPPAVAKGLYLTGWIAGSPSKVASIISLMKRHQLNSAVVDVKDYSGFVSYYTEIPLVKISGAEDEIRIRRPNAMIKEFHDNNIYVIARITVFQDPVLAKSHPEWAIKDKATGKLWRDRKGLSWMDTAAKPVWDYNITIAKDALARGFDEVQVDYVRFPSDGDLDSTDYTFWNKKKPMWEIMKEFFSYFREQLPGSKISADIFGLTTVATDDLGIGQRIEDAYKNFDYVSPMVYPSHFATGFIGYKNPAQYPYEVVKHSMQGALERFYALIHPQNASSTSTSTPQITYDKPLAKLRPWLQVFDLGANYNSAMVQKQINAVEEILNNEKGQRFYGGWLLWDPSNTYKDLEK